MLGAFIPLISSGGGASLPAAVFASVVITSQFGGTALVPGVEIGNNVTATCTITNQATGLDADPDAVSAELYGPDKVITALTVTKLATGVYVVYPKISKVNTYTVRFFNTGTVPFVGEAQVLGFPTAF